MEGGTEGRREGAVQQRNGVALRLQRRNTLSVCQNNYETQSQQQLPNSDCAPFDFVGDVIGEDVRHWRCCLLDYSDPVSRVILQAFRRRSRRRSRRRRRRRHYLLQKESMFLDSYVRMLTAPRSRYFIRILQSLCPSRSYAPMVPCPSV